VHQLWQPNNHNTLHTPPAHAQLHCCDVASLAPGQSTWPKAAQLQIDDRLAARAGQCEQLVSQQGVDSQWFVSLTLQNSSEKKKSTSAQAKKNAHFCLAIKKGCMPTAGGAYCGRCCTIHVDIILYARTVDGC
jgi:hypothetical protein